MVVNLIRGSRVGHIPIPGERIIACHSRIEVKNRFAVFIERNRHRVADGIVFGQHGGHGHIANARGFIAHKDKSLNGSSGCGAQFKCDVICADSHWIATVGCLDRQSYFRAVYGVDAILGEIQSIRLHDLYRFAAQNRPVELQSDCHSAERHTGENTILQGGYRFVRDDQSCTCGQICGIARSTDTQGGYTDASANRQIVCISGDQGMVKFCGRLCCRDHHERGADRALITIRRTVDYRHLIRTLLLGCISSGTAAIQVDCGNTARFQHDLGNFFRASAH